MLRWLLPLLFFHINFIHRVAIGRIQDGQSHADDFCLQFVDLLCCLLRTSRRFGIDRRTWSTFTRGCRWRTLMDPCEVNAIASVVRQVDAMRHPSANITDAVGGTRTNGTRRGYNQTTCDWLRDGDRIECKRSQLIRTKSAH